MPWIACSFNNSCFTCWRLIKFVQHFSLQQIITDFKNVGLKRSKRCSHYFNLFEVTFGMLICSDLSPSSMWTFPVDIVKVHKTTPDHLFGRSLCTSLFWCSLIWWWNDMSTFPKSIVKVHRQLWTCRLSLPVYFTLLCRSIWWWKARGGRRAPAPRRWSRRRPSF